MRGKSLWKFRPVVILVIITMLLLAGISFFWNKWIFTFEMAAAVIVTAVTVIFVKLLQDEAYSMLRKMAQGLDASDRDTLYSFPLPAIVTGKKGEVLWYNDKFRETVLGGRDAYGFFLKDIASNLNPSLADDPHGCVDIELASRRFSVYGSRVSHGLSAFYWIDDTELKRTYDEYRESRPVVAILMIDNYDELVQNAKEGEKSEIISLVERTILAWVAKTTGFLRHSDRDKYIFVLEERHLKRIIENRFDILDSVRQIVTNDRMPATLSIGVGRGGASFAEDEELARQALDMALGRGGDQAAIKTKSGFEFYGGVSKAVEKRTKVRTRIIASALSELIDGSSNVLIMGHKNSDLDVIGSAASLYKGVLSHGKTVKIAVNLKTSLALPLITQLQEQGYRDAFIGYEGAMDMAGRDTLLIIVDTHRQTLVEFPELFKTTKTIVVIDHHRKMVDFIDNAVVFYHEPFSSSTCEMVSELMQYIADDVVTNVEANALLAGITLDTRNFTVRTGVRTFEAAAYLRRKGADTANVRLLFSGSMESFHKKVQIVSNAEIYKNCAISVCEGMMEDDMRVVAPQAADELLTISGVSASFVIYPVADSVAVSARSMGKINVQLLMELLGGGGHQTMAGVQLRGISPAEARGKVVAAIDKYFDNNR